MYLVNIVHKSKCLRMTVQNLRRRRGGVNQLVLSGLQQAVAAMRNKTPELNWIVNVCVWDCSLTEAGREGGRERRRLEFDSTVCSTGTDGWTERVVVVGDNRCHEKSIQPLRTDEFLPFHRRHLTIIMRTSRVQLRYTKHSILWCCCCCCTVGQLTITTEAAEAAAPFPFGLLLLSIATSKEQTPSATRMDSTRLKERQRQ